MMGSFAETTKGTLSDADVDVGKAKVKAAYLSHVENGLNLLDEIGMQAVALGQVADPNDVIQQLDSVTTADVNKVGKISFIKCNLCKKRNLQMYIFYDRAELSEPGVLFNTSNSPIHTCFSDGYMVL